jgi:hypothetical protein
MLRTTKFYLRLLPIVIALLASFSVPVGSANAATFDPNHIMDDGVFNYSTSMSTADIQNFLNQFPNSCLSNYLAPYPTDYFTYGANVSAAAVIRRASDLWGINPQVILVTLEKEQSSVTGGAGCASLQYNSAMGMGCSDGGTCPSAGYAGFSQQVTKGAYQLMFNEQRSEGNTRWDGDDGILYIGYMTAGNRARCGIVSIYCSQSSTAQIYYDGNTPIDGTSVYMSNGATAAFYTYTPHFHGNQNVFTIFNNWFGSTYLALPIGGSILSQTSTGKVYLTTDTTRYYIPDWSTMVNYGLDVYPIQAASDSVINGFTDGGTLMNLVYNGNGVFLVNNRSLYHVSGAMCTAWGFSCFDSTNVKSLGSIFQTQYLHTGWELTNLAASKGVIYEMLNGLREPIQNQKSFNDLGFATTSVLETSQLNSNKPLGPLLMTTPGVLKFAPSATIYYFDGSNYSSVSSMSSYTDWSLQNQTQIAPATSSYNTTPPSAQTLTPWYQDQRGGYYIIDHGYRVLVPNQLQSLWKSMTFSPQSPSLANSLPVSTLQSFVWASPNIYVLSNGTKHYVPTYADYTALGITNSNTTVLQPDKLSNIPQGNDVLGNGLVIGLQGDALKRYVINNGQTTWVPDENTYNSYGFNWGIAPVYSSAILSDYPLASSPLSNGVVNGTYYLIGTGIMHHLSLSQAADYGLVASQFQAINPNLVQNAATATLSRFIYNVEDGKIYYASGGAIHYVANYSSFVAYGGIRTPATAVNTATINLFVQGQPV